MKVLGILGLVVFTLGCVLYVFGCGVLVALAGLGMAMASWELERRQEAAAAQKLGELPAWMKEEE